MIFVFVVDTSASMNRSFSGNLSYLESAKSGIEHFFKWEHSSSNRMNNKYMLVTYEDQCYKTLLDTDNDQVLLQEVKLLQATDLSTAGATFGTVLEYLDAYRRSNSFDTIGRGRYPADSETTTIFWFTDGSNFSEKSGDKWVLSDELHIPRLQTPGQEFYHEPFRWDQRLFTLWMTQAVHPESKVPQMSTVMRGEWWQIPNVKYLMQCIDNCMHYKHANVHPFAPICNAEGVLVNMIESPVTATNGPAPVQTLMIYSNKSSTHHFPIPEAYWVDAIAPGPSNILTIPPRSAHPTILYTKRDDIYPIPEGFPVDRFSIDQKSEIVQELMKQKEKISWTLFVQFSNAAQDFGAPFGTLKYSESSKTVSMYLMPYNFPLLFAAILELRKRSLAAAAAQNIADYVRSVPIYYREPLRRAFAQINIMNLWPADIPALPAANPHIDKYYMETVQKSTIMMAAVHKRVMASRATDHELLRKRSAANPLGAAASPSPMLFENVFDIPREALIPALTDLRNALRKTVLGPSKRQRLSVLEEDARHTLPISQMGNYAPRMYKQQRLRDPLEDEDTARQRDKNVFGNPYRTDKKVSIDEEDEAAQMDAAVPASNASTSSSSNGSTSTAKRKRRLPPRSTTSTTVSFNRARVPTISKMKLPFLDIPPLLAWRDVKAASPRLKETRIARENLIAAYRSSAAEEAANAAAVQAMEHSPVPQPPPSSTQPPIIAAGMTPPQPPVPQQDQQPQPRPVVPTIATTDPDTPRPLPQKQSPPLQQQLQQLQAQQTLSPISPDSPTTPPTPPAAAHASLRAQIRELIWRVPKHYNSQAIITLLHHLDADARTAILPYAIQCAEKCRRFGLVDKIRAVVGKQSAPSSSSHRVSPSR